MKIIIVGCGKVGYALAEQLSREGHEITVVDTNCDKIQLISDNLDVMGLVGNGATIGIQRDAGVENSDLLIATTCSDELNMLCCMIAKKVGKDCHTIARIRNPEYSSEVSMIRDELNLSMYINPELAAAGEISRIIKFPMALKRDPLAKGRVELIKFEIPEKSVLHGMNVKDIYSKLHESILIGALERKEQVFIPTGDFVLQSGDDISIVCANNNILPFLNKAGIYATDINSVMIVGGGRVAYYLATLLEDSKIQVKIIERDADRCDLLSESLSNAMILHGDGSDEKLLLEEDLENVDAFCAMTGFDEENIMLSLYAGSFGHAKLFTKITRTAYEKIIHTLDVGSIIQPKQVTADRICQYVRAIQNSMGSNVTSLVKIANGMAEALEFSVTAEFPMLGVPIQNLPLIGDLLIAAINRDGKIFTPRGNDSIKIGDGIIIVTSHIGLSDLKDILI